jgi:pyruvate formate lyase activating enzyme
LQIEAKFYKALPLSKVRCVLCPHRCTISNGKTGICRVRVNIDGVLYSEIYGELTSYVDDPVEKKPLFHFFPGRNIFSIGTWGCNFHCNFCQNWAISQRKVETEHFEKEDIINIALGNGSVGIAYTYNEPTIWYEFVYDTSVYAHQNGLKNVLVTNGFISEEPLREILPHIDAMNIDLKASSEAFYREVCGGQLEPVLRSIKIAHEQGVHVELTTLVIPTLNDMDDIEQMTDWVASVSPEIPIHLSRYYPQYKMTIEPTEIDTLKKAYDIAKKKLKYVYLGNVPAETGGADTVCPKCGRVLIKRKNYSAVITGLDKDKCAGCGEFIKGVFE